MAKPKRCERDAWQTRQENDKEKRMTIEKLLFELSGKRVKIYKAPKHSMNK